MNGPDPSTRMAGPRGPRADLGQLEAVLGCAFGDRQLLQLALVHPSACQEGGVALPHNQRLEFLGDAVLQLLLTSELYRRFPAVGEGALTKTRARLVNRRSLAEHARRLGLGGYLVLGRGEELHGGRDRAGALADCLEAVIGALYLDGGLEAARRFVLRQFGGEFEGTAPPGLDWENPKGALQECLQADSAEPPRYRLEKATGPDHDRQFECVVCHRGVALGRGQGKSKKAAESEAAAAALRRLRSAAQPVPPPAGEPGPPAPAAPN